MQNYVYSIIFWYEVLGTCFYIKHFQNVIYKMYGKKWGDDTYSYSHRLFKKCFVKICEILQFHIFLILYPIFLKFSLFFLIFFLLLNKSKSGRDLPFNPFSTRPHQNVVWYNNSWILNYVPKEREKIPARNEPSFVTVKCCDGS